MPFDYDPPLVQLIKRQKLDLLEAEKSQMVDLTGAWLNMESRLTPAMSELANYLAEQQANGKVLNLDSLLRSGRYKKLVAAARREMRVYLKYAESVITSNQRFYGALALSDAVESLSAGLAQYGRWANFKKLPGDLFERLVGIAQDGKTKISSLLSPTRADSIAGLTNYLAEAMRFGDPAQMIRAMQNGFAFGFNRTLNTARTETLNFYRNQARSQWAATGLVPTYRRVANHDSRVCPGCLMSEGRVYTIDESLDEHSSGRCFMVPDIIGQPKIDWLKGEDWFYTQEAAMQESILGPGRYSAWVDGQYSLNQLVTVRQSDQWGNSIVPTPLKNLVAH